MEFPVSPCFYYLFGVYFRLVIYGGGVSLPGTSSCLLIGLVECWALCPSPSLSPCALHGTEPGPQDLRGLYCS